MNFLPILLSILVSTTALFAQPTITSFAPASGSVGTLVTITGTNLSNSTTFTIGGKSAIVVSNNGATLVGMVMPGATNGNVSVTTASGTVNSSGNFTVIPTSYPSVQQGGKLVGSGAIGTILHQGYSVSISADGNTAIVGAEKDNSGIGAAWVYTRSAGMWIQQGPKLIGTGAIGNANQGASVSISADGNTAIVGGWIDNTSVGAAWIYTRTNGVWTQQGSKLVGTGAVGEASQGQSVSISADGNTAIVGGWDDDSYVGAVWVYTRSNGVWTQQGSKLVGTGAVGASQQGVSVSISADGSTAIVGGYFDNSYVGAAWVYTRSNGVWTQQGSKLVGTGAVGEANQGISVSISADGNTAIVGGWYDNSNVGAAWVYTRTNGVWTQQGTKLVGAGNVGGSRQGLSVSISADGNSAIVGGPKDNSGIGAAWVYTRSGGVWAQQGTKLVGTGYVPTPNQGWSVSISSDGNSAIVSGFADNLGAGAAWIFVSPSLVPVKLMSFTGEKQGTNNLLHWATATEQNNKGFDLLRSANGESFNTIVSIATKADNGNSTSTKKYSYTDKNPLNGNNYYRLKQIDNDGKETLSNIVLIKGEKNNEAMQLSLSPNPSSNQFILTINTNNTQPVSIRVTDAAGKIVYTTKGNAQQTFSFGEGFSNGVYIIEVRQEEEVKTIKAVKRR